MRPAGVGAWGGGGGWWSLCDALSYTHADRRRRRVASPRFSQLRTRAVRVLCNSVKLRTPTVADDGA